MCQLKCRYCVNRLIRKEPTREYGIMNDATLDATLSILKTLVDRGTQAEVNMNGNGESCIDTRLPKRIRAVKDIVGNDRTVQFCTNGVNMTRELAGKLKDSGVDRIDISIHDIFHARKCADIFEEFQINGLFAAGALMSPHDWAGQMEPENRLKVRAKAKCDPLIEGRAYVQSEGTISPCCYDFRNLGTIGTVFDENILERFVRPYELCHSCHQIIPDNIIEKEAA